MLSDILCAITESRHVTKWRVALVSRMAQTYYKGAAHKEWKAVVNMAHKFAFLRPEIVPQAMHRLKRSADAGSSFGARDALGYKFEGVWKDRTPMDAQLDDLGPESRLTWQAENVFRGPGAPEEGEDDERPRKRRQARPRVGARLNKILDGQEPNPIQEELDKHRRTDRSLNASKMPLSRCQKVGEVYDNLNRLAMPARSVDISVYTHYVQSSSPLSFSPQNFVSVGQPRHLLPSDGQPRPRSRPKTFVTLTTLRALQRVLCCRGRRRTE